MTSFRGIDLSDPDKTTSAELAELRAYNRVTKGYTPSSHEFWLTQRPDVFKRMLRMVREADSAQTAGLPVRNLLAALHYYVVIGYGPGVEYEIRNARAEGASRGHVLDTMALGYVHAHARGMNIAATVAAPILSEWVEDGVGESPFPAGWSFDPTAFATGLDFTNPDLSDEELELVESWYIRAVGFIPSHISFLAHYRPRLLKAYRNRIECVFRNGLPKQMFPYSLLYLNVIRGSAPGIRENFLLARHFGVEDELIVSLICRAGTSYAGVAGIATAVDAVGDLLDSPVADNESEGAT